ncbi:MAG: aminopeptidase [candidate division NC10 bacterium]|nr:aminopeptidase [candidate division NC10 bacterium]
MIGIQMAPTARRIVETVLAVKPGEQGCVVTDTECPSSITGAVAAAARAAGAEVAVVTMTPREAGSVEPPAVVGAAIQAADAVIWQATYAVVHTRTARAAFAGGVRLCDMWGFTEDMMVRGGATADYAAIADLSRRLAPFFTEGREARLTTPAGTDLTVSLVGRQGFALVGLADRKGTFCALPDGEATISPVTGSAEGILVHPFCIEKKELGYVSETITIEVAGGRMGRISGGPQADFLAQVLDTAGGNARNIAEFAVGTNPSCRLGVTLREAKKAWGTAHIGIGDSKSVGGDVEGPLHFDLIFTEPTVTVDGYALVRDGKVVA